MTEFLFDALTTLLMGLFTGNQLGFCYILWFHKREELSESQRRYVIVSATVGLLVMLWFFIEFVVNLVRAFTQT